MAKSASSAAFWTKQILIMLMILVAGLTLLVLLNQEKLFSEIDKPAKDPAKGMSDFYAEYRMSSSRPAEEEVSDFVVELDTEEAPIDDRMERMESLQSTVAGNWVGEHKFRNFRAGSTLREAISEYAQSEGMQVMWELDQDFIIKSEFQLQDTLVGSLKQISEAVGANFDGDLQTWFCPKQRALVITNQHSPYLKGNCTRNKD